MKTTGPLHRLTDRPLSCQRTWARAAVVVQEQDDPVLLQVEPPGASRSTLLSPPPNIDVTAGCEVRTRCSSELVEVSFMRRSLDDRRREPYISMRAWCQVVEATSRRSYVSRGVSHPKAALGRSLISSAAVLRGHCNSRCRVLHRNVTSRVTSIAAHASGIRIPFLALGRERSWVTPSI